MSPYATNDHFIKRALDGGWYEERIAPRLVRNARGCLIWTASTTNGYAQAAIPTPFRDARQVTVRVSRVAWLHLRGEIPVNYVIDHDGPNGCSDKACCDPAHLQVVTIRDNTVATGNSYAARSHRGEFGCVHPRVPGVTCADCQRERDALRGMAARAVGLKFRDYAALYGLSVEAARHAIASTRIAVAA